MHNHYLLMKPKALFLMLSLGIATMNGCSRNTYREGIDPSPEALAARDITESFGVEENTYPLSIEDRFFLTIKKSALGKEFLLHGSAIPQNQAPTGSGLQARVVRFHYAVNTVFLLESNQGHVVTHELPSTLILAEIPIIRETDSTLTLDFNKGMSAALVARNWHASDYGSGYPSSETIARVLRSFIQKAELRNNAVEIRQIAQVDSSTPAAPSVRSYEFRYYLSPYRPNPDFLLRETSDFQHVGYFEIAPRIEPITGRTVRYISRWDDSKPITFHVSANTPSEYVEAIREGVLYWNKAFGRELLKAEVAPKGVTAPDPRYNIIQWVENESAGSAYADALMDPRTGEILHAQVFLTSVFAVNNRGRLPGVLRRLKEQHAEQEVGPSFFHTSRLCQKRPEAEFARTLEMLVSEGATDEALLQATRNYLKEVTAHEIGHTLGLRHNFAASLASNVTESQRDEMLLNYLLKNEIPRDAVFTSSVMEYNALAEAILSGAQSSVSTEALPYDRTAIAWGYEGRPIDPATAPLFCTDSHALQYRDCVRFDTGASPIAAHVEKTVMNLRLLPISFAENFIRIKTAPDPRDRMPFERLRLSLGEFVNPFITSFTEITSWFRSSGVKSIRFERQFPYVSDLNQDEILKAQRAWVNEETARLGGASFVVFGLLPKTAGQGVSIAAEMSGHLDSYLMRDYVLKGTGYDGKPYELSVDEVNFIRLTGKRLFTEVEKQVIEKSLDTLANGKFALETSGEDIERGLGELGLAVLLEQTDETVPSSQEADALKLRKFRYSHDVRIKAVKLLAKTLGELHDWSAAARAEAAKRLGEIITSSLRSELDKIDQAKLSRPQKQWLAEQQELLKMIGQS